MSNYLCRRQAASFRQLWARVRRCRVVRTGPMTMNAASAASIGDTSKKPAEEGTTKPTPEPHATLHCPLIARARAPSASRRRGRNEISMGGLFHDLARAPRWYEARHEEAESASMLVALGRQASESSIIGTRAQVLYVVRARTLATATAPRRALALEGSDGDEVIEVEVSASMTRGKAGEEAAKDKGDSAVDHASRSPSLQPPPQAAPVFPLPSPGLAPSEQAAVEKEMIVGRPIADVFAVVSDFDAYPTWVNGLQSVETLERDQDSGIGRVVRFTAGAMGLSISYTLQYTVSSVADDEDGGGGEDEQGSCSHGSQSPAASNPSQVTITCRPPKQRVVAMASKTRVRYKLDGYGFKMPAMLRRTATSLVVGAALPISEAPRGRHAQRPSKFLVWHAHGVTSDLYITYV